MDVDRVREAFPFLQKGGVKEGRSQEIYFDTAATAQKPKVVIDALVAFYSDHYATVHRAVYSRSQEATALYERTREAIKNFIKAEKKETIIFTKGTTESINLVARSFGETFIGKGDEILLSEMEHHSNMIPWQLLAKKVGCQLRYIPVLENGMLDMEAYKKLVTAKTKLIAITHISNVLGTINPIETMIEYAHAKGATVLIDGAQAAAHLPIDVVKCDADFYAFSAHKMYGPNGVGVLYGKKELLEKMPPFLGGGDMVEKVTKEKSSYQPIPLKFEAGTPVISEVIAFHEAIQFVEDIGIENIQMHDKKLVEYAISMLEKIPGVKVYGKGVDNRSSLLSFSIEGVHPMDIATLLGAKGISCRSGHMCAQPLLARFGVTSLIRMSFGVYNCLSEIDIFVQSLKEGLTLLR